MTRLFIYLFLTIGLFPNGIQAKWSEQYKDSLRQVIATTSGEDCINAHLRLAQGYMHNSLDSAIIHAQAGLEAALEISHPTLTAKAYDLYGRANFRKGNHHLATICYQDALKIAQANQDSLQIAHLNNSLAIIHLDKGSIEKSLLYLDSTLQYWEKQKDPRRVSTIWVNMGIANRKLKRFDAAQQLYIKALEKFREAGYDKGIISSLVNLGRLFEELADYEKALAYYQEALNLNNQKKDETASISLYTNMYSVLMKTSEVDSAEKYYQKAHFLAKNIQSTFHLQILSQRRAEHFIRLNENEKALDALNQSLLYAQKMGKRPAIMEVEELMGKAWQAKGNSGKAMTYFLHARELQDSIITERARRKMEEIEIAQALKQKEADIIRLKAENDTKSFRLYASLGIILLFFIASLALFNRFQIKRRSNQLLSEKNSEVEIKNKQLKKQQKAIELKNTELTKVNKNLKHLTYMASHDLRDPLMTVRGIIAIIEKDYGEVLGEAGKTMLQKVIKGSDRMDKLIEALLIYEAVGESQEEKQELDMNELLKEVIQILDHRIQQTKATITIGDLPTLSGYKSEVLQLFQNLLANALKFQPSGVTPEVKIFATKEPQGWTISIQDNGIGMDPQSLEKATEMFTRLNTYNSYPGSGIGLAICKKTVDHHGWTMGVESEEGVGARFWVSAK